MKWRRKKYESESWYKPSSPALLPEGEGSKMKNYISNTSVFDINQHDLPYSDLVNISALLGVFRSTAASYKYIFFISLLNILQETGFNSLKISLDDILLEMLAIAWFPHNYFKLNFGINDRIAEELDRLKLTGMEGRISNVKNSKSDIKAVIPKEWKLCIQATLPQPLRTQIS